MAARGRASGHIDRMEDWCERPKLRALEATMVADGAGGRALMLRDAEAIADEAVLVPAHAIAIVARFDGHRTLKQIAGEASRVSGMHIEASAVRSLVDELDAALLLESPASEARRWQVTNAFRRDTVRRATHAGGAYHDDPATLARFIEEECFLKACSALPGGRIVALSAPHMDLWRAASGYGHAYRACAQGLSPEVDTLIVLGTCHAPMRRPFAVCEKTFETPLGDFAPDHAAIAELSAGARFDIREEEYLHKQEHSIEFQAVFLKHLLGDRRATIVPVLCGLGEAQTSRSDPTRDPEAESFLSALQEVCERRGRRVLVVSGADLAHVGPRFGDARALDEAERRALRARDEASIRCATDGDAAGFFADVAEDQDTRRVCGLGPIYTLLRLVAGRSRGQVLNYDQCIDPIEGSIVSHASLGFYA
jgi:AmmeMemoRadiSam system protein B